MTDWFKEGSTTRKLIVPGVFLVILIVTAIYRFYQPVTHQALLQFDVFDWATRSQEWLVLGDMKVATSLWVFPIWNAIVAKFSGLDLFQVYLFSGAIITTLNLFLLYGISSKLWRHPILRFVPLVFYAFNTQLLARSVNYLPETLSFTFGLALIYFYLQLVKSRRVWWIAPILVVNYLYYHLHQSGINFMFFTGIVLLLYILFIVRRSWKQKLIWLAGSGVVGLIALWWNTPLRNQITFFLTGDKSGDIAFKGTPIPFSNFFSDYPTIFSGMFILGAISLIFLLIRRRQPQEKVMWGIVLMIVGFYYSFLYLLPNLNLYSLVPWRFYTWFSLYAILIAAQGVAVVFQLFQNRFRKSVAIFIFLGFMVIDLSHGGLIRDNMFTADAKTLQSMQDVPIPDGSIVYTTNANFLQTKYAFVGRDLTVREAGTQLFRATSSGAASTFVQETSDGLPAYVLISLYQLRQRPNSIDYWRNSAIFDMDLTIFQDGKDFDQAYLDQQILVFSVRPASTPRPL